MQTSRAMMALGQARHATVLLARTCSYRLTVGPSKLTLSPSMCSSHCCCFPSIWCRASVRERSKLNPPSYIIYLASPRGNSFWKHSTHPIYVTVPPNINSTKGKSVPRLTTWKSPNPTLQTTRRRHACLEAGIQHSTLQWTRTTQIWKSTQ